MPFVKFGLFCPKITQYTTVCNSAVVSWKSLESYLCDSNEWCPSLRVTLDSSGSFCLKKSFIGGDYPRWCLARKNLRESPDCSSQISHEWGDFFSLCDSSSNIAKATHIYYWCICKIAAIYFMTTFILLEYYKLESRGRKVHIPLPPLRKICCNRIRKI